MAFPVILVNSTGGSDSAASGAGPSTALTGSAAATDGTGLVVTLDGSPDLTGVLTDGSHVLYLADATASARNFSAITAKDNTAKTVTVISAFGASQSGKSWAIGGKRATIASTSSLKLFTNGTGADLLAGWAVEMQSGHAETIAATITINPSGGTDGPIILRGEAGAGTKPLLTFSNNASSFATANAKTALQFRDFELRNTNATKTTSTAIAIAAATNYGCVLDGITVSHSTNKYWRAFSVLAGGCTVENCDVGYCASVGMTLSAAAIMVRHNSIHHCTSHGVAVTGTGGSSLFYRNRITDNGGDGINDSRTTNTLGGAPLELVHNVISNNTGDGYESTMTSAQTGVYGATIENNVATGNSGYQFNFSGSGVTAGLLTYLGVRFRNNNTLGGTGSIFPTALSALLVADPGLDPQFANAGAGNYVVGSNLRAKGFPLGGVRPIAGSTTHVYIDIGAGQHQDSGGGETPTASDLRDGVTVSGVEGTLVVPDAAQVLEGTTFDNGTEGTASVPSAAQVLLGVQFGAGGDSSTGTITLPAVDDVRAGTTFGPSLGSTGTVVLPAASDVLVSVQYGADGTELTGILEVDTEATITAIDTKVDTLLSRITTTRMGRLDGSGPIPTAAETATAVDAAIRVVPLPADVQRLDGEDVNPSLGVTLATSQPNYAPAKAGDTMALADGAIIADKIADGALTAAKFAADVHLQSGDAYPIVAHADYGNAQLVRATTPANKLDVASTGEAGLDFANIKQASGATTLSNITVPVVGSVTGNVAGSVASVTGNVGGNVAGSVASVTAGVTVTSNQDKTGYSLNLAQSLNSDKTGTVGGALNASWIGVFGKIVQNQVAKTLTMFGWTGAAAQVHDLDDGDRPTSRTPRA